MKVFKLKLSEQRGMDCYEGIHEKYVRASNEEEAYNSSLYIASTFFNDQGVPDKDFIFHFNDRSVKIWINSLEELELI